MIRREISRSIPRPAVCVTLMDEHGGIIHLDFKRAQTKSVLGGSAQHWLDNAGEIIFPQRLAPYTSECSN